MKFRKAPAIPEGGRLKTIATGTSEVFKLDPRLIQRQPGFNTRYDFGDLEALAADIEANGVLEALKVRKDGGAVYLINGDRRLTAIGKLIAENRWPRDPANPGYPMPVPCTSEGKGVTDSSRIFMMLSLNTGKPFTLLEKGYAYRNITLLEPDISGAEIARRTGETKQAVSNALILVNQASPDLIDHIKHARLTATTALEIIRTTDGHDDQNAAATAAIRQAAHNGRDHATPKDLNNKPPASGEWEYIPSDDFMWNENHVAECPTTITAGGAVPHCIAMLRIMVANDGHGIWSFGYNLQCKNGGFSCAPQLGESCFVDESTAVIRAWQFLQPRLGLHALACKTPQKTLAYLTNLGHALHAKFPIGIPQDVSLFTPPPAKDDDAYIADPSDSSDSSDLSDPSDNDDDSNSSHKSHKSHESPTSHSSDSPADPGAHQRLKDAPSANRDGTSGGPGGGYANNNRRIRNVEELMDELYKDDCDPERWDTTELILDYLNGNHTIATIRKHLLKDEKA